MPMLSSKAWSRAPNCSHRESDPPYPGLRSNPHQICRMERSADWRDEPSTIKQFHMLQRIGASEELLRDALGSLSKGAVSTLDQPEFHIVAFSSLTLDMPVFAL